MKFKKSPLAAASSGEEKTLRMRRIFKISLIILVLVAATWIDLKLHQPTTLPIKVVRVEGVYPHLNSKQFQQAVAPYATGGFFSVDLDALKDEALTFPWIYQVDIRKIFPDTLVISITEQTPVALWNQQALLNADGDIFQPARTTFPTGLPTLTGPEDQSSMMLATFEQMNQLLKPLNLQITALDLSARRAWTLTLNNHTQLLLGRDVIWQRLQQFISVYPKVFASAKKPPVRVDLRYPNGFAVQW